jgi:hypothetical protein
MEYCPNCGAASREGARFCTTCGVRLELGENAPEREAAPVDTGVTVAHETLDNEGPTDDESRPEHVLGSDPIRDEPHPDDQHEDSYLESWPVSDARDEPANETTTVYTAVGTGTDANDWPDPQAVSSEPEPDRDTNASGWAGRSAPPATSALVPVDDEDNDHSLDEIRELVTTLQSRLDRLTLTAAMTSRGVEIDDLADHLDDWARDASASDDLLEVIRETRANPRDLDVITRLADRADHLERLVKHYSTIRTDAERWAARLRSHDGPVPS